MKIIKRSLIVLLILVVGVWAASLVTLKISEHEYTPVTQAQLVQAKAYLSNNITPAPTEFEWSMFDTNAGVRLRTGLLEHPNPKGTVVVVPGFTGAIEMIMREITRIHAAGYRVAAIEYRGQGLSHRPLANHPEKGYVEDYGLLGDELGQYANKVKREGLPLFFFSISKGAHITMRMAAEQKVDAAAYALIVPMIQVNPGELAYDNLKTIAKVMTSIGLGEAYVPGAGAWPGDKVVFGEATDCNANPDTAQAQSALFAINEKLRTRGVTYKWLYETTNSTDKLLDPDFNSAIRQPVKVYTAGIDTLVRTDKAEQFCNSLESCETQHFPESRHCITREDYDLYDEIIRDAISHFDTTLVNK